MFIDLIFASVTFCKYFQFHFLTGSFVVFLSSNFFNCWEEFKVLNFCPCQPDVIRAPLNWTAALSTNSFKDKSVQTSQIKNNALMCPIAILSGQCSYLRQYFWTLRKGTWKYISQPLFIPQHTATHGNMLTPIFWSFMINLIIAKRKINQIY